MIHEKINTFLTTPPYLDDDFRKRNWGDPWHSLCSYHGKLKPSIAHFLVSNFTEHNDIVLDPLSGVGTIPLEARIQGRIAIANDLSPLAATVSRAKITTTDPLDWRTQLKKIEISMVQRLQGEDPLLEHQDFGLNGKISEYFHPDTLREILVLRELMNHEFRSTPSGAFIFSCFAHVLHGNRPYALSRRSHSLTPYAPSGPFEDKNVIQHIADKAARSVRTSKVLNMDSGAAYQRDYQELRREDWFGQVDAVITSPPFVGSMKFHSQNWLRLWLAGWEHNDFKNPGSELERNGKGTLSAYRTFLEFCYEAIRPGGIVVLHTGKNKAMDMGKMITNLASDMFENATFGSEDVQALEKHGLRDKGGTTEHQFVFLKRS